MQESQISEWMEKYDWEQNPFTFRIYPDLMIGYEDEHQRIKDAIDSNSKLTLLLGNTGAGKTTLLRRIEAEYMDSRYLFYMSKPPVTEPDLLQYLENEVLDQSLLAQFMNSYSLYNIHDALNKKYTKQMVLLVDEGHEASIEVLEWLRTAMDHIDRLTVVAAGLPEFEGKLKDEVNTLYSRATDVVRLNSLDRDDTLELIRKRIEHVGGRSIEPFTQDAVIAIYEETDGFPREVLRVCNDAVVRAANKDKSIIDEDDVDAVIDDEDENGHEETPPAQQNESSNETNNPGEAAEESVDLESLTDKQLEVFEAIKELEQATSGEIVEHMGMDDYKSRSHAIRSINNILRRLMEQELVTRKRKGRNYLYSPDNE
jgi:type II secretory pathway predicted ATPase ExeA